MKSKNEHLNLEEDLCWRWPKRIYGWLWKEKKKT